METSVSQKDIETALRLLQATRERARKCYYKNQEERQRKRREYYHAQKKKKEGEGGVSE